MIAALLLLQLTLTTEPPGLKIYAVPLDTREPLSVLGKAGQPLPPQPGRSLTVRFGYGDWVAPEQHTIDLTSPPAEAFHVELPWAVWLAYHHAERWAAALVLVATAAGAAHSRRLRVQRREAEHAARLAALKGAPHDDPNLFRVIAGYRLVSRLGQGGMAVVYKALPAESLDETQAVAVKLMQCDSEADRARFRREAEVSSRLMHPNIVRILDAGDQDGQLYLVLELVRGTTLRQARPEFASVFGPILNALEYAHRQGVVHRDLKPDNVMIAENGRVVVMDFGLAVRPDSAHITAQGAILGTPAYMSPEQIRGLPLDARSDQYSLGVLACELLTGRLPFAADDPLALLMKHLQEEPDVPNPMLKRMLAKNPEDRYPSLRECREAWQ